METQLDSFPVAQLTDRYSVARSNIYNRLQGLGIQPEKQGSKSVINADHLALMDALDQHLKAGGTIADFAQTQEGSSYGQQDNRTMTYRTASIATPPDFSGMVEAIANQVAERLRQSAPPQPLALAPVVERIEKYRRLNEICEAGYRLSTSDLAPLLGLKTLPGKAFDRYGFHFSKTGKNGAESAWQVTKGNAAS